MITASPPSPSPSLFDSPHGFIRAIVCVQLGDGTTISRSTPTDVAIAPDVLSVACGAHHTCTLMLDGGVRCWGLNIDGQVRAFSGTQPCCANYV